MPKRRQPGPKRQPPPRKSKQPRWAVRLAMLCKPGEELLKEPPPDRAIRQHEWEKVLSLRPGELSPEEVAKCQRRHDMSIKRTLDELYHEARDEGGSHVRG